MTNDGYTVTCTDGTYKTKSLVIATGGLSIPKMGASDFGYRLARQFDLNIIGTRAGLVPFTLSGPAKELSNRLSGISLPVHLAASNAQFSEGLLFTHRGLAASNEWSSRATAVELLENRSTSID